MVRAFAAIAVATAFHLLAALDGVSAAARPMGRQAAAASRTAAPATSELALAPAGQHQRRAVAAEAARVGKWLPFAGVHHHHRLPAAAARAGKWLPFAGLHHHLPAAAAYWAHSPVPWVGVGAGELGGAGGEIEGEDQLVREREREPERERRQRRPSYEGDGGTTDITRQEQLAMWASLLNPKGKGRTTAATGWLPAPRAAGAGEVADDEPAAKAAADAVEEGADQADDTAADEGARVGRNYWGNNGN